jgi:hypothetical protein
MKMNPSPKTGGTLRVALFTNNLNQQLSLVLIVIGLLICSNSFGAITSTNTTHVVKVIAGRCPLIESNAFWFPWRTNAYAVLTGQRYPDTFWTSPTNVVFNGLWVTTNSLSGTNANIAIHGRQCFHVRIIPAISVFDPDYKQISGDMLTYATKSSDPANSLATIPVVTSYSYEFQGLDYGIDRIKGTSDDRQIISGALSQLVDEITWTGGPAVAYRGNTDADIASATNYVNANLPFSVSCSVQVVSDGGSIARSRLNSTNFEGYAMVSTEVGNPTFATGGYNPQLLRVPTGTVGIRYNVIGHTNVDAPVISWTMVCALGQGETFPVPHTNSSESKKFFRLQPVSPPVSN